jgi:uncharacterized protein (DUF302 family)
VKEEEEMNSLGMTTVYKGTLSEAKAAVTAALKEQGFGVLTEIDVRATLREKLGVEMGEYLILGACNPQIAHRALIEDPSIGLLLPCNVVLRAVPQGVEVSIVDPEALLSVAGGTTTPAMIVLEREAKTRLEAALTAIARPEASHA